MLRMSVRRRASRSLLREGADTRLPRIRYACASTHSNWMRRMPFCCAMERPSLSRQGHSGCSARSHDDPAHCSQSTRCLTNVWGHQFVSDSVLKTAVSEVRKALDDDPRQPRFIETVSRRGYRFIAPTSAAFHRRQSGQSICSWPPSFYAVERLVLGGMGGTPTTPVCVLRPSNAM